jgi:uncharacterized damage-inducible protein DinB
MSRRAVLMEALAATPRDLERITRMVAVAQGAQRPDPAGWSVAEVVAHMAEIEVRFRARLRLILAEDNPTLSALDPDETAHDLARPLPALVAAFAAERVATLVLLAGLEQRDWGRPLVHPADGPTRFREQVQALVTHDNDHLAQISSIREQL